MHTNGYTVFIVEDDQAVRDSLGLLLGLRGHPVAMFADAESFLRAYRPEWRGCLLADIRMPGMDGISLQKCLIKDGCRLPVIVMTGHGNVDTAREAFRAHAVDFLEKPIDHAKLMSAIEEAFARQAATVAGETRGSESERLLSRLTPREREVMDLVVHGRHNREIAEALHIPQNSVSSRLRRARAMLQIDMEGGKDA